MKVLFTSTEIAPISQLGGLGSVVMSLPLALSKLGINSRVVIPFTLRIKLEEYKCHKIDSFSMNFDNREEKIDVWQTNYLSSVPIYILENKRFFHSEFMHRDFRGSNTCARYAFFSKAILELIMRWDYIPDIIHIHDYYTSFIVLYQNTIYKDNPIIRKIGTLLTIHSTRSKTSMTHHSIFDFAGIVKDDLPSFSKNILGEVNILSQGILNADLINTVSPTYADELLTPQFGHGIEKSLFKRRKDFVGVLNGIDITEDDPEKEGELYIPYSIKNIIEGKHDNKIRLLDKIGLPKERQAYPMISMVTRLDEQKGLDLILEIFDQIIECGFSFALLGDGSIYYINKFKKISEEYSDKVKTIFSFDSRLSKLIYAGSDFLLMPSRFEPCGLTQMISMRFGTPPLVRLVGGLKDTVQDGRNGFGFKYYSSSALLATLKRALKVYQTHIKIKKVDRKRETEWEKIVKRAMKTDVSWEYSAKKYIQLYSRILDKRKTFFDQK